MGHMGNSSDLIKWGLLLKANLNHRSKTIDFPKNLSLHRVVWWLMAALVSCGEFPIHHLLLICFLFAIATVDFIWYYYIIIGGLAFIFRV